MTADVARWPYKFVHAVLRIVLETGKLNLQANTPALSVKEEGDHVLVETERGIVKAKRVIHATVSRRSNYSS